jgi:hypothetical protein
MESKRATRFGKQVDLNIPLKVHNTFHRHHILKVSTSGNNHKGINSSYNLKTCCKGKEEARKQ